MAKAKKTRDKKYQEKLAIKGNFMDIIGAVVKNANDKVPKKKSDSKDMDTN